MILTVRRASGFPIIMEPKQEEILYRLESEERYTELEQYEKQLIRDPDQLHEIKVEADKLEEVLVFLNSLNHVGAITLNFQRHEIIIEDTEGFSA